MYKSEADITSEAITVWEAPAFGERFFGFHVGYALGSTYVIVSLVSMISQLCNLPPGI